MAIITPTLVAANSISLRWIVLSEDYIRAQTHGSDLGQATLFNTINKKLGKGRES